MFLSMANERNKKRLRETGAQAEQAWKAVSDGPIPYFARLADLFLAFAYLAAEDLPACQRCLRRAIDSGHPIATPGGWLLLGMLLGDEHDEAAARDALQRVLDSAHPLFLRYARETLAELATAG